MKKTPDSTMQGDKGYKGEEQIRTPQKKPKKKELSQSQKDENKKFSSERVFVDHVR